MERAKRARGTTRSAVTRRIGVVEADLAEAIPDKMKLTLHIRALDTCLQELNVLDEQVMEKMLDDNASDEDLDTERQHCQEYLDKIEEAKWKMERVLHPRPPSPAASFHSVNSESSSKKTYKLPKIKLKKFSGELTEWLGWWAQFEKIDADEEIHETDKFQYLHQCMIQGSRAYALVERYPQTKENYSKVIAALKDRFGKPKLLTQVYVRELIKMILNRSREDQEKISLSTLYDKLESYLSSLESLQVTVEQMAKFLFPMVESCIPEDVFVAWQRSSLYEKSLSAGTENPPKTEMDYLLLFLKQEIEREEQRHLAKVGFGLHSGNEKKSSGAKKTKTEISNNEGPTSAGLLNMTGMKKCCVFCEKPHESHDCWSAPKMTLEEREVKVRNKKVCNRCLKIGHFWKTCKFSVKCSTCGGRHQTLLCRGGKNFSQAEAPVVQTTLNCTSEVVLQTLMIRVTGENGKPPKLIRALIDTGSHRSFLKKSTSEELGLKSNKTVTFSHGLFGGTQVDNQIHNAFQLEVKNYKGQFSTTMKVFDQQQLCGRIPRKQKGPWMNELKSKKIWINDLNSEYSSEIEMLIGADNLGKIVTGRIVPLSNGLTANETRLGWTLMGETETEETSNLAMTTLSMHLTCANVSELWRLDTIGIHDPVETRSRLQQDLAAKKFFMENVSRNEEGRFSVGLPWVTGRIEIPNNRAVAERRLQSAMNKLNAMDKVQTYGEIFKSWENEGIISEVPTHHSLDTTCHYLPHRAVFKESKTTPVRPVFDASCKVGRAPSLNDCLEKGPNLLELIPSILLRFRMGKIGVISDIRKAFLMIEVKEEDRDYLRFLWWEDDLKTFKTYKHNRVVFGLNCSPFLLGAVIEYHLGKVETKDKKIAEKLLKSLYVDNCVASVSTMNEYEDFKCSSTRLMADAKMELREWEYSSESSSNPVTSVLGLRWDKMRDSLHCALIPGDLPEKISKRVILSQIQKIFDPLGFLCPALLIPKLMLQKMWTEKGNWDMELSADSKGKFEDWWSEMSEVLDKIQVPRHATGGEELNGTQEIHCFTDASKDAFAAVVFLRVETNQGVSVQLLQAKSRVAPMKRITIPRLELLSCGIGARLTNSIKESLSMANIHTVYWSDSTTALAWIQRNDDWGTFVGNRVREICSLSNSEEWRHVPGTMNPADLPSRGCNPKKLLELAWWEGPSWLKQGRETWPAGEGIVDEEQVIQEKKKMTITAMNIQQSENPWWVTKHSSFIMTVRIVAMVLRYADKLRKKSSVCDFQPTQEEVDRAELRIISLIQAERFTEKSDVIAGLRVNRGKDGIIRVVTKLTNRPDTLDFRQPMLLPSSHPLVERLLREEHTFNCHAGVQILMSIIREKYWVIHSRRSIKKIVKYCVICRRYAVRAPVVPSAPLPEERVTTGKPFETTGVDLAGPLILKDKSKCWIVLYTCAVYRCVHLELVQSLSTEDFLMSLVRFCKRKRRPSTIFSDNGTNFGGSVNLFRSINWKEVEKRTQQLRIKWRFDPPSAPWWGGWWERLIRSMKDLLKRMLGFGKLTHVQLETCLTEVEAAINHRPLTFVTEGQDDLIPLTPAMFIHNLPETGCPEMKVLKLSGLQSRYRNMELLTEELRSRFRNEYLSQLVQRGKEQKSESFKPGDVVLIEMDNKKRIQWPMARILELMPGKDGKSRVARVKTAGGELIRPLRRLFPLEVSQSLDDLSITPEIKKIAAKKKLDKTAAVDAPKIDVKTKSGRQVKAPVRLGF